jgi:predicted TIM-barrel fold metal-dependent hydrolase
MAAPTCLPAQAPRRPRALLPGGSCDTHIHVFGDPAHCPLDPRRNYTPVPATLGQYREVMAACGIGRAVLVQPSVYGTDNRCLLEGLREGGAAFRGIAVVGPEIADAELDAMHALGVRGLRLNVVNPAVLGIDEALALAARTGHLGWHLQVHVDLRDPGGAGLLASIAARCPVPLVVDHMGRADPAEPAPPVLLRLLAGGKTWVKLSAAYRLGRRGAPAYEDVLPLARALVAANPERLLWASDWPHSELFDAVPQDADLVDLVPTWLPDAALRQRVCVENPARLYGYPAA